MDSIVSDLYPHSPSNHTYTQPSHVQAEDEVTIGDFQQLQELELRGALPNSPYKLLSSIASLKLRKIIFTTTKQDSCWKRWPLIDRQLCELVDRLRIMGYRHTLEVELQITVVGDVPAESDFATLLSDFRERGIVTIVYVVHGD